MKESKCVFIICSGNKTSQKRQYHSDKFCGCLTLMQASQRSTDAQVMGSPSNHIIYNRDPLDVHALQMDCKSPSICAQD